MQQAQFLLFVTLQKEFGMDRKASKLYEVFKSGPMKKIDKVWWIIKTNRLCLMSDNTVHTPKTFSLEIEKIVLIKDVHILMQYLSIVNKWV